MGYYNDTMIDDYKWNRFMWEPEESHSRHRYWMSIIKNQT